MLDEEQLQELLKSSEPDCPEVCREELVDLLTTQHSRLASKPASSFRFGRKLLIVALTSAAAVLAIASVFWNPVPNVTITNRPADQSKSESQVADQSTSPAIAVDHVAADLNSGTVLDEAAEAQNLAALESRYRAFKSMAEETENELSHLLAQMKSDSRLVGDELMTLTLSANQTHASEALWLASEEVEDTELKKELLVSITRMYPDSAAASRSNSMFHH